MIIQLTCLKCGNTFMADNSHIHICCGSEMSRKLIKQEVPKETMEYSRCKVCGMRRAVKELIEFEGDYFCKDNGTPSCYMKRFWEKMEQKHKERKNAKQK